MQSMNATYPIKLSFAQPLCGGMHNFNSESWDNGIFAVTEYSSKEDYIVR